MHSLSYTGPQGAWSLSLGESGLQDKGHAEHGAHHMTITRPMNNLELPISLQNLLLDWGSKLEKMPETQIEHVITGWRQETNPQPTRCEANLLTTKPLSHPYTLAHKHTHILNKQRKEMR